MQIQYKNNWIGYNVELADLVYCLFQFSQNLIKT